MPNLPLWLQILLGATGFALLTLVGFKINPYTEEKPVYKQLHFYFFGAFFFCR
jgi:hypothetical protein